MCPANGGTLNPSRGHHHRSAHFHAATPQHPSQLRSFSPQPAMGNRTWPAPSGSPHATTTTRSSDLRDRHTGDDPQFPGICELVQFGFISQPGDDEKMRDLKQIRRGVESRALTAWRRGANVAKGKSHGLVHPCPELANTPGTSTLDLGCGPVPRNPFQAASVFGVDVVSYGDERIHVADLSVDPIPFPDETFDYVTAYDFLEHIPRLIYVHGMRKASFIEVLNEIHRVLKPGGIFHSHTPAFPRAEAFSDPTHVNTITEQTVTYFTADSHRALSGAYGFRGRFELIDQYWDSRAFYHLVWQLRALPT